jgi:hypothetical protein
MRALLLSVTIGSAFLASAGGLSRSGADCVGPGCFATLIADNQQTPAPEPQPSPEPQPEPLPCGGGTCPAC